ncbi:AMP-binding protein [Haloarcula pellucida]|uniref:Acetyl-CoA synthetase n=1 Tax=Haloarcula pellucida TaxID=1427151 RepID=A0A830GI77_9EURY|nr:AMP-binding protein [Halomicroarcula pellucida]MBX0347436.1 AMP-binding protein [Halomicroarcula pellucida]GGN88662.1 acetyl-CoA synthetase [Halomicroarcula pellucida]
MTGPWTGYELPASPTGYGDLRDGFEWQIPDRYNIADHALSGDGDAVALRHVAAEDEPYTGTTMTYGELAAATRALAARLADGGIAAGDRVAVCLPQCPELVVAHLAVYRLGGVVVPVSMLLGEHSFGYVLDHSDASALVVDSERWNAAGDVRTAAPTETVPVDVGSGTAPLGGLTEFVGDAPSSTGPPAVETRPDDPALVLYTSGTTSDPKGVVQGHQYLLGSLPGYHCWFDLFDPTAARRARVWTPSEWAWAGALFDVVFPTLALGGTVVSSLRRAGFDPERALDVVAGQGVTHAFLPPTALRAIRRETDPAPDDVPTLETMLCGGEHLPDDLAAWATDRLAVTVNEAYGQTEANALAGESNGVYPAAPDGLGRPYPGHEIVVVDEDGAPVPTGEGGEIAVVRPDPVVMQEYVDDPAATAAVLDDDLLRTGDIGRFDDGVLTHLGRADDLVLTAGYRVSPLEVESALEAHPAVSAALVRGEPDPERGQRVVATVVPSPDVTPDDDLASVLKESVAESLGPHKRPRDIDFVSSLPTTRTDKADRSGHGGGDRD